MASVEWVSTLWSTEPRWVTEPDIALIEQIAREQLHVPPGEPCRVTLFAQGAFNKLYEIHVADDAPAYLIRVALPVEPRLKTLSEVATLDFVRAHCNVSLVPRVLAYEANAESTPLGFEWMIMEKLPGTVLEDRWRTMSFAAKEDLVRTLVGVLANLYEHPLRGIGNIYLQDDDDTSQPTVNRIVSMVFFWDQHRKQDVPRGPFRSSAEWLSARLSFVLNDAGHTIRTSEDEDDVEEAEEAQALAHRLLALLPKLFSASNDADSQPERTIILHDDLSFHNLLVDDEGRLTGIIDWECVSALPVWYACQFPSFLTGRTRTELPDETTYALNDDGTRIQLYGEHLREWEQTQLRDVFLCEMERVQPEWVRHYREPRNVLKADFEAAVTQCDAPFAKRLIGRWIDRVEAMDSEGDATYISLRDDFHR
ncbi:kinase-like protein [Exidia glandulosa HHB12029]|uniref:Kinase-like protein n=1 Tax=Exidia glandulosa HHB12029 TaxID=1314781 RepID=A0A165QKB8_EXIGL|nr:kinase-like protein [Exidia glandulosa HHB12029]